MENNLFFFHVQRVDIDPNLIFKKKMKVVPVPGDHFHVRETKVAFLVYSAANVGFYGKIL